MEERFYGWCEKLAEKCDKYPIMNGLCLLVFVLIGLILLFVPPIYPVTLGILIYMFYSFVDWLRTYFSKQPEAEEENISNDDEEDA